MNLELQITRAWEATNDAGGALASALHALRGDDAVDTIHTPGAFRRPAKKVSANDRLGEALLLIAEAKRHGHELLRRAEEAEATLQQELATR